ncbi:MAG: metal ABC transporter substrate-binding protein [Clostridia bacterium]|nr:metal ABC transporter substrate-binding protein [Clostridia bacterium]
MRKIISLIIALLIIPLCVTGCAKDNSDENSKKLNIVATVFPQYDWTREILGEKAENANLTLLLDNGVDLHSYQPTAKDIVTVSNSDIFIYVGGESDEWVDDVLKEASNENLVKINLMECKGNNVLEEETVEGMEEEEHEEHEGEEETEYDEHVWLSLKNAKNYTNIIADEIAKLDPENADYYKENAKLYAEKLDKLDGDYEAAVKNGTKKTLLFADRFPFRYMTNDYGLKYFAAFKGCSAESEASFETISFLANKVNELGLNSVITLKGSDNKIAKTVITTSKNKNLDIVTLDSMQTTTSKDANSGETYLKIATDNLESLKKALS